MAAPSNPSQLSKALREFGRIERTLFMIEWYSSLSLRRRCQAGLNKGEARSQTEAGRLLPRRGDIRDRSFDGHAFRASGLNLVVNAIVHWNTVYSAGPLSPSIETGVSLPTICSNASRRWGGSTSI